MPDEEVLRGGVANAGAVRRVGDRVVRPASAFSPTIFALLRHVRRAGFVGVPEPLSLGPDGREWLSYLPGDVPFPPYPAWSQTDTALATTAALLRRFHDATVDFVPPPGGGWSPELADDQRGDVVCHNDVCPENVVFRDGSAVALLDFDFAAPGRRVFDVARMAVMTVPVDDPGDAARTGRGSGDPFARLRVIADGYGLAPDRSPLVAAIAHTVESAGPFVRRRVERGEPAFIQMVEEMGGMERYDRRRRWFAANRERFEDAAG